MSGRYLVTGAAGLIGHEVARQLLEAGGTVVAAESFRKGGREDLAALAAGRAGSLEVVEVDLAAPGGCDGLSGSFDAIFHLAAIVGVRHVEEHPWETIDVNLRSTLAVFDLAIRQGCGALVFASSSECYACGVERGVVPLPTPEDVLLGVDDVALPRWTYAASKIAGESALFAAAREGDFTPQVVRFHNTYGPRMGPTHVVPEFLDRCARKLDPFPVHAGDQTRSFLHVEDSARAVLAIACGAGAGQPGVWHVGSGEETRISDLVQLVFEVSGHHPELEPRPTPPGSVARRVPDVSRLGALGFEPGVPLRAGLEQCWRARIARGDAGVPQRT